MAKCNAIGLAVAWRCLCLVLMQCGVMWVGSTKASWLGLELCG